MKIIVCTSDGGNNLFDIVARDTLVLFLFIFCRDYVLRTSKDLRKEIDFIQKKRERSRHNPAETITDADYVDDLAPFVNTPAQIESLMHRLEQGAKALFSIWTQIKQNHVFNQSPY